MNELATIDAPEDLRQHVSACVRWSNENSIANASDFDATANHLKEIKSQMKAADLFFDPPIKQAYDLHKMLVARKKVLTDPLAQSERIDKAKMLAYQQAEQAKAEAERRRLQAIADEQARREREKIEQAAAKQRAIEAEARAKAEAARQAEEKARREAEVKEDAAIIVVAPVVAVATSAPKVSGISTRKIWTAEVVDQAAFLAWACEAKRYDLLLPNNEVLKALAKGLREAASMPGIVFKETSVLSAKGS